MRIKEFIIFIIIFTILYVSFFVVFDIIRNKKEKEKEANRLDSLFNGDKFLSFLRFYGVENNSITNELLKTIYQDIRMVSNIPISTTSEKYQVSAYEFIVVILYFEYFQLIGRKNVSFESNIIRPIDYMDQQLIMRYGTFFLDKQNYSQIVSVMGMNAVQELDFFEKHFLSPGVRIINSTIYYVGGIDE